METEACLLTSDQKIPQNFAREAFEIEQAGGASCVYVSPPSPAPLQPYR